ncbi:hypothetical protein P7L70_21425 [Tistrella mobilis]|uniref:hypothetical protein n=1 Tax=Tistrella mobilis TaxID=171437 RepID=UPI003557CB1A
MPDALDDPVGAAWLMRHYGIALPGRLPAVSGIGGRRMTQTDGVVSRETWVEAMRPAPHPAAHLQFHLRHEVPHLDFLARLVAASPGQVVKVPRWRVNDNLPGTRHFCPILVRRSAVVQAAALDVSALFRELVAEFGVGLLMRAAAWLILRESRASFAIEGEADQATRIQRFADVMARRMGQEGVRDPRARHPAGLGRDHR